MYPFGEWEFEDVGEVIVSFPCKAVHSYYFGLEMIKSYNRNYESVTLLFVYMHTHTHACILTHTCCNT
jgi:hypothetical protein